jgi:hypothetical protein
VLPVITSDIREQVEALLAEHADEWKREMVHHLKEDNPEVNSLLLNIANGSADPKGIVMSGYLVYKALELAYAAETM